MRLELRPPGLRSLLLFSAAAAFGGLLVLTSIRGDLAPAEALTDGWKFALFISLLLGLEIFSRMSVAHRECRALRPRADALQSLADGCPHPMFSFDNMRIVRLHNAAFHQWMGGGLLPLVNRHLLDLFGERSYLVLREAIGRAEEGETVTVAATVPDSNGNDRNVEFHLSPEGPSSRASAAIRCTIHEVLSAQESKSTEQTADELTLQRYLSEVEYARHRVEQQAEMLRRQSEELAEARDQALAATQAKSAFLANMSHELRTPLNGIVTMATLLAEENLTPSQSEYADIIKVSSDALLTIINDILDFSKIEAGKLTISPHEFELRGTLTKLIALLTPQMNAKDLIFHAEIDESVPDKLIGDSGRIRQVIINLIGNAIKFTPQNGAIILAIRAVSVSETDCALEVGVADSGIGIAPDKLDKIFGAFDQEDASTTRHYGGTGLGLSISRRLVELMGGKMTVRSIKGSGSTFSFTLPLQRQTAMAEAAKAQEIATLASVEPDRPLRILVAEDNLMNQKVAARLLSILGHSAHIVNNGREALEALEREGHFDLILMDCHMPEMDGYETTRAIREQEKSTGAHLPIIGLTAATMKSELDQCAEAGMDDQLTKPVPKDVLREKLREIGNRKT